MSLSSTGTGGSLCCGLTYDSLRSGAVKSELVDKPDGIRYLWVKFTASVEISLDLAVIPPFEFDGASFEEVFIYTFVFVEGGEAGLVDFVNFAVDGVSGMWVFDEAGVCAAVEDGVAGFGLVLAAEALVV